MSIRRVTRRDLSLFLSAMLLSDTEEEKNPIDFLLTLHSFISSLLDEGIKQADVIHNRCLTNTFLSILRKIILYTVIPR